MQIVFSKHALYQLKEREISKEEVVLAFLNPNKIISQTNQRFKALKIVKRKRKKFLLIVVFEKANSKKIIITAFLTSKIKKYL